MYNIDLSHMLFIQPTWVQNTKRLEEDPPFMYKSDPDEMSEHELELEELTNQGELRQAKRYDYYRDVVHISSLIPNPGGTRGPAFHMIVSPEEAAKNPERFVYDTGVLRSDAGDTYVQYFPDEASLLTCFWHGVGLEYGVKWIASWNMMHGVWPLLIGKALQYRIPVPSRFRADPFRRFQNIPVLSVDTIYTQGVYFKARPLPQLVDIIEWWGLPTEDALPPLTRKQISMLTVDEWKEYGYRAVEKYLHGMADIVEYYYEELEWNQYAEYAGDPSLRGPQPPPPTQLTTTETQKQPQ